MRWWPALACRATVFVGPLFVMEKMAKGFSNRSGDWRYTMIMPDGSLFGRTKGEGSERVEFRITCQLSVASEGDHLFFVPKAKRVQVLQQDRPNQ